MSGVDSAGKGKRDVTARVAETADFLYQVRRIPGMTLIVSDVAGYLRNGTREPLVIDPQGLQKVKQLLTTKYNQTVGTQRAAAEDLAYLALRLEQQGSLSAARALAAIAKPVIDQALKAQQVNALSAKFNMDSFA
jgi:hypothetical protein